jgi:hypothetical protein
MYLPQVSDLGMQRITITGATGGTFTLSYEGTATASLAFNATATQVQTSLRALSAIGVGGCKVSGRPGGPYTVTFQGVLATDAGPLSGNAGSLTGTTPSITIESATDDTLQLCLDNATDTVRSSMRSLLADPLFDYLVYGAAASRIVRGSGGQYLTIGAHSLGSVTTVAYESGSVPAAFTALNDAEWDEMSDGRLWRAVGWTYSGVSTIPRYQVTAVWGYGATVPGAITEVTLELAVTIWRTRDRGGWAETVGADGGGAVRYVSGLTKLQSEILISARDQLITIGV